MVPPSFEYGILLPASNFDKGKGGSQGQDHGQAIYATIRYGVSSTFATGCWLFALFALPIGSTAISSKKKCVRACVSMEKERSVDPSCYPHFSIRIRHPQVSGRVLQTPLLLSLFVLLIFTMRGFCSTGKPNEGFPWSHDQVLRSNDGKSATGEFLCREEWVVVFLAELSA